MNAKTKAYIDAMAFQKNKYRKEDVCQYRGTDKWCKATTNKKCDKCKFFVPTTQAVFEACAKNVSQAATAYKQCEQFMRDASRLMSEMEEIYDKVEKDYARMNGHGTVDMLMKEIWEASVNTYGM